MPKKTVFSGQVEFIQVLDKDGLADEKLLPKLTDEQFKQLYYWMVLGRQFDDKCLKLQRSGRVGTFAQILGQEAQVGAALAMKPEDWLVPSFRENALLLARGVQMEEILLVFGGDETGNKFGTTNNLPISVPVGTQPLHAVGIAWAFKLRSEKKCVVAFFGDGATSEGDVHEALNLASVFQVPCVFVCQNNQWAISVPRSSQSHSQTLAQKALGYGMEGIQADGNDVLAVYATVKYAVDKARLGGGPTFIELMTYRMADHTTADDATRYRTPKEVAYWKDRDPIKRFEAFLKEKKLGSDSYFEKVGLAVREEIEKKAAVYLNWPKPSPGRMFEFLYANPPEEFLKQKNRFEITKKRLEESP